jgi:hypothetical protein
MSGVKSAYTKGSIRSLFWGKPKKKKRKDYINLPTQKDIERNQSKKRRTNHKPPPVQDC